MSPVDSTARELRDLRTAVEVSGGETKLLRASVSWMRDNFDKRVRDLEQARYEAELERVKAMVAANARKPPLLPWRLFFCSLAAAVLAVAGTHIF
jgi:hypothetical protein